MSYVSDPSPRTHEPPFDPHAYHEDIKAHPEKYIALSKIVAEANATRAIRKAETLDALTVAFQAPAKAAKAAGNEELLGWLTEAAKKRRKELEAI